MRPEQLSDVGVVGLCSAGRALALRLAARELRVSIWDASSAALEEFVAVNAGTRGGLVGYANGQDFFESLHAPRRAVAFQAGHGPLAASLRLSWGEPDRILVFPADEEPVSSADLDLLEMTLVYRLD